MPGRPRVWFHSQSGCRDRERRAPWDEPAQRQQQCDRARHHRRAASAAARAALPPSAAAHSGTDAGLQAASRQLSTALESRVALAVPELPSLGPVTPEVLVQPDGVPLPPSPPHPPVRQLRATSLYAITSRSAFKPSRVVDWRTRMHMTCAPVHGSSVLLSCVFVFCSMHVRRRVLQPCARE